MPEIALIFFFLNQSFIKIYPRVSSVFDKIIFIMRVFLKKAPTLCVGQGGGSSGFYARCLRPVSRQKPSMSKDSKPDPAMGAGAEKTSPGLIAFSGIMSPSISA